MAERGFLLLKQAVLSERSSLPCKKPSTREIRRKILQFTDLGDLSDLSYS